jgi:cellulose synthase/poly-beta-1,6-N-acetylglucosamine synthase-like glycosyltransferase
MSKPFNFFKMKGIDTFKPQVFSGNWLPTHLIERDFVHHRFPEISQGEVCHKEDKEITAVLSVVIPTADAYRDGYFLSLLDQIGCQKFRNYELIVVRGDSRQGRAINVGAALAAGKYILTLDDDTSLPDPDTFHKLVAIMETHPEIGIAGGNNVIPDNAGSFVRRAMKEIPRRSWAPVHDIIDSDLAEHPCMIMRTEEFKAIGGENELLPRGLDPYLREEFRKIGQRVVLVPEVIYHHLPPDSLSKLLRQFHRNGRQAAFVNRNYPQWVIETPAHHGSFKNYLPLPLRFLRFPIRLFKALITGKPIWFLSEVAYALGFAHELIICHKI